MRADQTSSLKKKSFTHSRYKKHFTSHCLLKRNDVVLDISNAPYYNAKILFVHVPIPLT